MTYDSEVRKPTTIVVPLSLFVLFARYAQTICFKWWQIVFKWKTLELDACVNIHTHNGLIDKFLLVFFILILAHLFCFGYYYSHALYVSWVGMNVRFCWLVAAFIRCILKTFECIANDKQKTFEQIDKNFNQCKSYWSRRWLILLSAG